MKKNRNQLSSRYLILLVVFTILAPQALTAYDNDIIDGWWHGGWPVDPSTKICWEYTMVDSTKRTVILTRPHWIASNTGYNNYQRNTDSTLIWGRTDLNYYQYWVNIDTLQLPDTLAGGLKVIGVHKWVLAKHIADWHYHYDITIDNKLMVLKSIKFPENAVFINSEALSQDHDRPMAYDYGLSIIGKKIVNSNKCFAGNHIEFGSKLRYIGKMEFQDEGQEGVIILRSPIPPMQHPSGSFSEIVMQNFVLYVPAESVELYKQANGWKGFARIEPLEEYLSAVSVQETGTKNGEGPVLFYTIEGRLMGSGDSFSDAGQIAASKRYKGIVIGVQGSKRKKMLIK